MLKLYDNHAIHPMLYSTLDQLDVWMKAGFACIFLINLQPSKRKERTFLQSVLIK